MVCSYSYEYNVPFSPPHWEFICAIVVICDWQHQQTQGGMLMTVLLIESNWFSWHLKLWSDVAFYTFPHTIWHFKNPDLWSDMRSSARVYRSCFALSSRPGADGGRHSMRSVQAGVRHFSLVSQSSLNISYLYVGGKLVFPSNNPWNTWEYIKRGLNSWWLFLILKYKNQASFFFNFKYFISLSVAILNNNKLLVSVC